MTKQNENLGSLITSALKDNKLQLIVDAYIQVAIDSKQISKDDEYEFRKDIYRNIGTSMAMHCFDYE